MLTTMERASHAATSAGRALVYGLGRVKGLGLITVGLVD